VVARFALGLSICKNCSCTGTWCAGGVSGRIVKGQVATDKFAEEGMKRGEADSRV
jgi:hypothetical protein